MRLIILIGMKDQITASDLSAYIHQILDSIITTGIPINIIKKGRKLHISGEKKYSRLDSIKKRDWLCCKPKDLLDIDWSHEWSEATSSVT